LGRPRLQYLNQVARYKEDDNFKAIKIVACNKSRWKAAKQKDLRRRRRRGRRRRSRRRRTRRRRRRRTRRVEIVPAPSTQRRHRNGVET
jgi:hypothetical protein